MTSLPADVMEHMLPYFDAVTWAKMAQVSKTWNQIAYRPSVWAQLEWKPTRASHPLFLKKDEIPKNARHIGEPTKLCFQAWAQHISTNKVYHNFNKQFVHSTNKEGRLQYLYSYWSMHKPCIHTRHHVWTDVFKARAHLNCLSQSDILRLYVRIMDDPGHINPYRSFIENRIHECSMGQQAQQPEPEPGAGAGAGTGEEPGPTDLIGGLLKKILKTEQDLEEVIRRSSEKALQPYIESRAALSRRGEVEFNANGRRYNAKRTEMLDSAAFSVPA